jgi:hypothetical protein
MLPLEHNTQNDRQPISAAWHRRWREDKPGGLAVVGHPSRSGERPRRSPTDAGDGTLNCAAFTGSTMLVAGGGFCVGVSRAEDVVGSIPLSRLGTSAVVSCPGGWLLVTEAVRASGLDGACAAERAGKRSSTTARAAPASR